MKRRPQVTILTTTYNRAQYLREALDSCLAQSFTDFEILIVDDASTDDTGAILALYRDERIRVVRNERNLGMCSARNRGLSEARGELVAQLDSDDIALPFRLERQVAFMAAHPDVGVCGSWAEYFSPGHTYIWRFPTTVEEIRAQMVFHNPVCHSSTILRPDFLARHGLRFRCQVADDYDLWVRALDHFPVTNIGEVLVRYRVHDAQLTRSADTLLQRDTMAVCERQIRKLGLSPTREQLILHVGLPHKRFEPSLDYVMRVQDWLRQVVTANQERNVFPEPSFTRYAGGLWESLCRYAVALGAKGLWRTVRSPMTRHTTLSWRDQFYLLRRAAFSRRGPP
jgi:glycosyltransferase involved in cell wall biosynthesis